METPPKKQSQGNEERIFIHDIAGTLGGMVLLVDFLNTKIKALQGDKSNIDKLLLQLSQLINKMEKKITDRRSELIGQENLTKKNHEPS